MRYYCPGYWSDFAEDLSPCPRCGLDIRRFWESNDFLGRLIVALGHPEQDTRIRAAWILGQRRNPRAVAPLIEFVEKTQDVYAATAAVEALGRIGTPEALAFLERLEDHRARMVREAAQAWLSKPTEGPHA